MYDRRYPNLDSHNLYSCHRLFGLQQHGQSFMMNSALENLLYQSGLTAQGCWDELDDYAREGIERFAQLIVRECAAYMYDKYPNTRYEVNYMRKHMGDPEWNLFVPTWTEEQIRRFEEWASDSQLKIREPKQAEDDV